MSYGRILCKSIPRSLVQITNTNIIWSNISPTRSPNFLKKALHEQIKGTPWTSTHHILLVFVVWFWPPQAFIDEKQSFQKKLLLTKPSLSQEVPKVQIMFFPPITIEEKTKPLSSNFWFTNSTEEKFIILPISHNLTIQGLWEGKGRVSLYKKEPQQQLFCIHTIQIFGGG